MMLLSLIIAICAAIDSQWRHSDSIERITGYGLDYEQLN